MIELRVRTNKVDEKGNRVLDSFALDKQYHVTTTDIAEALNCRAIDVNIIMVCFGVAPTIYAEVSK